MKKRGLKRYYRNLFNRNLAENFIINLKSGAAKYDFAHIHFDGYVLNRWNEIKLHLDALFRQLSLFKSNAINITMPFQVWGHVCFQRDLGCQVSLYVHTPNSDYDDFPMVFTNVSDYMITNRKELHDYLNKRQREGYEIRYSRNCDNEQEIVIAIMNVGLPIFTPIKDTSDETDR